MRAFLAAALLVLLLLALPQPSRAQSANSGAAQASCNQWAASRGRPSCTYYPIPTASPSYNAWCTTMEDGVRLNCWIFEGAGPPDNPCTAAFQPANIYQGGKVLSGSSICGRTVDQRTGATVQCALTFSPKSPPTQNAYSGGWETYGTLSPSGNFCGGIEGDPWKDGNGGALSPPPPVPTLPAVDVPAPPKMCGDGSCYDPKADQYCATAGGQQFCVSGATARSAPGGCAMTGDAALCAGSPNPPKPPADKIPDPATQIKAADKTTQADPTTGAAQTVTTVVYNQPSTPTTNGQQSIDKGPAPSGSTAGPSYAGGGNCNTPPVCSGDAVMCGVARQTWKSGCDAKTGLDQLHKDLTGDGTTPDLTAGAHTSADVWSDGTATGDSTADAANAGNYDTAGLGFSTVCPLHDMQVPVPFGQSFAIKFSAGCEFGGWLKAIIIAFATFAAARITAGGTG